MACVPLAARFGKAGLQGLLLLVAARCRQGLGVGGSKSDRPAQAGRAEGAPRPPASEENRSSGLQRGRRLSVSLGGLHFRGHVAARFVYKFFALKMKILTLLPQILIPKFACELPKLPAMFLKIRTETNLILCQFFSSICC